MKIIDSPHLDSLYEKYEIDTSPFNPGEESIHIHGKGKYADAHLIAEENLGKNEIHIESLEGRGIRHELMIIFLIEAYYRRVEKITLDSRTKNSDVISQKGLDDFYRRFGFTRIGESFLGKDTSHMEGVQWSMVVSQIQKYITRITHQI